MDFSGIVAKSFILIGLLAMQASCSGGGSAALKIMSSETTSGVVQEPFGSTDSGEQVVAYTLTNRNGLKARLINYGATLTEMFVPDRNGQFADVVLGFDSLDGYLKRHPYFGSTVGRVANRIAGGRFVLNGRHYQVATNNGPNHLHGGMVGFDARVWQSEALNDHEGPSVRFTLRSADGDEGYPGNLSVEVFYTLTHDNQLRIEYLAKSDRDTVVNLTNHAYWNLAGHDRGSIKDHLLELRSDFFTPVDATSIPTGEISSVTGTLMDFTSPLAIGARIHKLGNQPPGYDHNYVLRKSARGELSHAATLTEGRSGRVMEVWTTEPGLQIYTSNYLDGSIVGKANATYKQHAAVCLEAQKFPDAINKVHFSDPVLPAGEIYRQTTVHKFLVR